MCRLARLLWGDRNGATALEFALVLPIFLGLTFSTLEVGLMMARATLLDTALEKAVRQVRLGGKTSPVDGNAMRKLVCENAYLIVKCNEYATVEMVRIESAEDFPDSNAICRDRGSRIDPATPFTAGAQGWIMFVRVCVVTDPIIPGIGLAAGLNKDSLGGYWMVAKSALYTEWRED